jgi:hypothetical protein
LVFKSDVVLAIAYAFVVLVSPVTFSLTCSIALLDVMKKRLVRVSEFSVTDNLL